jgi:hypothetical protein
MGLSYPDPSVVVVHDPASTPLIPGRTGAHNIFAKQEMSARISIDCNDAVDCNGYHLFI